MTMADPNLVESKLVNYCEADDSERRVRNNRYHYVLEYIDRDIGISWLHAQVGRVEHRLDGKVELEAYEIESTDDMATFRVSVREVQRRDEIVDEGQNSLADFE